MSLISYGFVQVEGAIPQIEPREVSQDIEQYLLGHVFDLLQRAERGSASPAFFREDRARDRFERLRLGSVDTFQSIAQDLGESLHTAMDGRSKKGFFVVLRRDERGGPQVAILKLDVHDEIAAAARRTESGQLLLEAVRDLLDVKGELQKGAVFPDSRPGSEVVVGDKLSETSLYFLRSLGLQQVAAPKSAAKVFLQKVSAVNPGQAPAVARVLSREDKAVSPRDLLERHPSLLGNEDREAVVEQTSALRRPIRVIDTTAKPLKEIVTADGIEIRGHTEEMQDKVSWYRDDGAWLIQVRVQQEPRRRWE